MLIRSPNLCYATQAPSCGPPRGGFPFGLVVYLILLVPPLWGILPNSLRQQGLSGNSLCNERDIKGISRTPTPLSRNPCNPVRAGQCSGSFGRTR